MSIVSNFVHGFNTDRWWNMYSLAHRTGGILGTLFTLMYMRYASNNGGYVGRETIIDGKPELPHGLHGIHISRESHIGRDCIIYQNVTIGAGNGGAAVIEDGVMIGANAVLIGGVHVGKGAKIGAGAIVVDDVLPGSVVVSPKAVMIKLK